MNTIREDAARWFVRMNRADADHPERGRFEAWLLAHPQHAEEYEAFAALWSDFDSTAGIQSLVQAQDTRKQQARQQQAARRKLLRQGTLGGLLVLGAGIGLGPRLLGLWRDTVLYSQAVAAAAGERKTLTLPDGSTVVLNGRSQVSVTYTRSERRLALSHGSEAIFDVHPDAERPFTVDGGLARITVLGTRFAVSRSDPASAPSAGQPGERRQEALRVSVAHGRVRVASAHGPGQWELLAGEALDVDTNGGARRHSSDPAPAFEWAQGVLVFDNAGLDEIATRLSRHLRRPVRLGPGLPASRVTAVVQASDSERFLQQLPQIAPVRLDVRDGATLLLPR